MKADLHLGEVYTSTVHTEQLVLLCLSPNIVESIRSADIITLTVDSQDEFETFCEADNCLEWKYWRDVLKNYCKDFREI